eukprot:UN05863
MNLQHLKHNIKQNKQNHKIYKHRILNYKQIINMLHNKLEKLTTQLDNKSQEYNTTLQDL